MSAPLNHEVVKSRALANYDDARLNDEVTELLSRIGALDALKDARRVVLKPNWVHHENPLGHDSTSLVTQTEVIEAVAHAVAARLQTGGEVLIADAPVQSCRFDSLLRINRVNEALARLRARHTGITFNVADWRLVHATSRFSWRATERVTEWNERDFSLVDVGTKSFLEPVSDRADRFRVTGYAPSAMQARHSPGRHQYLVARRALEADVFINLPKLKTHIKAGITCGLKNLVGINGHKEFLPHHVTGGPETGGDSHRGDALRERFERYYDFHFEKLARLPRPFISVLSRALGAADRLTEERGGNFGSWPGNDTVWRMTLDLNHLLYAWAPQRPRRIFTLVDAITVGQGDGPLRPTPAHLGLLLAGQNPATIDAVGASLLGFDPLSLATIRHALNDDASIFKTSAPAAPDLPHVHAKRPHNWESLR